MTYPTWCWRVGNLGALLPTTSLLFASYITSTNALDAYATPNMSAKSPATHRAALRICHVRLAFLRVDAEHESDGLRVYYKE
ncbi:hypothetical protein B0H10DRAFT_1346502 [Mycena sp. CBHHK59/15]|nr:hypothetical protein B0H10DRAFT_1346502 [Mycena sp. CBHHK59/15]